MRNGLEAFAAATEVVLLMFVLAACSASYYGYTTSQWAELDDTERAAVRAEYEQAIDAKQKDSQAEPIAEDRQRLIRRGLGMDPEHAPY